LHIVIILTMYKTVQHICSFSEVLICQKGSQKNGKLEGTTNHSQTAYGKQ
jgi:hypothetical protein